MGCAAISPPGPRCDASTADRSPALWRLEHARRRTGAPWQPGGFRILRLEAGGEWQSFSEPLEGAKGQGRGEAILPA